MIVAVIFADRTTPLIDGQPPYLLPLGNETLIERVASSVLRGPFGGTVVVSASKCSAEIKKALSGFAVQHLSVNAKAQHANMIAAIQFAQEFRARWEKAMAAAAQRFGNAGAKEQAGSLACSLPSQQARSNKQQLLLGTHWARHSRSPDVKVRGLARSFERDGIMLFRGERPLFKPDLQAQLVEAFGREGSDKKDFARPFAQALFEGQRGYPILMSTPAAQEVAALPAETVFDQWLMQNLGRVHDVKVADASAIDSVDSAEDYERVRASIQA